MNSVNYKEIEKFSKIAEEWWDPKGKFKPLHKFNPIRIAYIKDHIIKTFKINEKKTPLKKLKILDIGCGRANIISSLQRKYKFLNRPIGIDILKNKHIKNDH